MTLRDRNTMKLHGRRRKSQTRPPTRVNEPSSNTLLEYFPLAKRFVDFISLLYTTIETVIKSPTTWKNLVRLTLFLTLTICLYASAWTAYLSFYALIIPKLSTNIPVYFNFGACSPSMLSLLNVTPCRVTAPAVEISAAENNKPKIFHYGQAYDLTLNLEVPESEANFELGNFMVRLELQNKERDIILEIERPAILKYRSELLRKLKTFFYSLPLIVDWATQKQTISIVLAEQFWDDYDDIVTKIFLSISNPKLQIYKSWLKVDIKLSGIKYIMYHWPTTAAMIFTSLFFFGEILFALISWQIALYGFKKFFSSSNPNNTTASIESEVARPGSSRTNYTPVPTKPPTNLRAASPIELSSNNTEEEDWERLSQNQTYSPKTFKDNEKEGKPTIKQEASTHQENVEIPEELELAREAAENLYSSYFGAVKDEEKDGNYGQEQGHPTSSNRNQGTSLSSHRAQGLDYDQRSNTLIEEYPEIEGEEGFGADENLLAPNPSSLRYRNLPKGKY
ncbi:DUF1226-domain-containing protein [Neoconidiobolus thromboides FSU 785]|nr:DUF1226-domain-containing protein [Neoconidiobolus thromboides FSU 785]